MERDVTDVPIYSTGLIVLLVNANISSYVMFETTFNNLVKKVLLFGIHACRYVHLNTHVDSFAIVTLTYVLF